MYYFYLDIFISFMVAPTEVLFIPSPLAFNRLHDDNYNFCNMIVVPEVIKEIATTK